MLGFLKNNPWRCTMEHRWGGRVAVDRSVRISSAGITGTGTMRDLSISGAFIETSLPLSGMVTVRIWNPGGANGRQARIEAAGFIVRRETSGFGVEWCELAALHPADLLTSPACAMSPLRSTVDSPRLSVR